MDYLNTLQHLANEQIVETRGILLRWEIFSQQPGKRLYADPYDEAFAQRFREILYADKAQAESFRLLDAEYNYLFLNYRQMNKSQILRIGEEFRNLYFQTLPADNN